MKFSLPESIKNIYATLYGGAQDGLLGDNPDLRTKIHQGHDPAMEYRENGVLLSNLKYSTTDTKKGFIENDEAYNLTDKSLYNHVSYKLLDLNARSQYTLKHSTINESVNNDDINVNIDNYNPDNNRNINNDDNENLSSLVNGFQDESLNELNTDNTNAAANNQASSENESQQENIRSSNNGSFQQEIIPINDDEDSTISSGDNTNSNNNNNNGNSGNNGNGNPNNGGGNGSNNFILSTPSVSVSPLSIEENQSSPLIINLSSDTTNGVVTIITVSGIPNGGSLSAGTDNGDGSWTLSPEDLSGIIFNPPSGYSGNFTINVVVTSEYGGQTTSDSTSFSVEIEGVASTPILNVSASTGDEDSAITLDIDASLSDDDGSETLTITISGVPQGAVLSAGTDNGDGTWTLTPDQLDGLTLTPPSGFSGDINLTVTATSNENGTTATVDSPLTVTVEGVASTPILNVSAATGDEDSAITLDIDASLSDDDGSETLTITISGVPQGAVLSAGTDNGDGTWTLSPDQLDGLTLTPPEGFSGNINLTVTATSNENGTTATTDAPLVITVEGVASTPILNVSAATGDEDSAIALDIDASLSDDDGSETLTITISGVPQGAVLSAGTDNGDGTWTLTPDQLDGLTLTPPSGFSGDINLTVTATSNENGTTATVDSPLTVTVEGVASTPILNVSASTGDEDSAIALDIDASLSDDDGSETLTITISGVPQGATLSAGTDNGDGTWTLSPDQLDGLTLTPPEGFSGNINLTVTATSSENGTNATTDAPLTVTVEGVASTPILNVSASTGDEDSAITLDIDASLSDDDGSETLTITISGVPQGAVLSAGTDNGDGTWTLTPDQLDGLTLTPPSGFSGDINLTVTATSSENGTTATVDSPLTITVEGVASTPILNVSASTGDEDSAITLDIDASLSDDDGSETLTITISGVPQSAVLSAGTDNGDGTWTLTPDQLDGLTLTPPSGFSGDINLTVTATSSENGTTATVDSPLTITVEGVANTPLLNVSGVIGDEDTAISLNITSSLTDNDGSENLSIVISGVPDGAKLSAGLYAGNGNWSLSANQLANLKITPPLNYHGTINLSVSAISTERDGDDIKISQNFTVTVNPVVDAPTLITANVSGNEDTAISLNITALLRDNDGSEVLSVRISGVPTGATLSAGTNLGGGVWTLTQQQLTGLKITPPANSNTDFNLNIQATSTEHGGTTSVQNAVIAVDVKGVADTPTVSANNAVGTAGSKIPLTISGGLTDSSDGSETLSYVIHGMPDGFSLNKGQNNGDNTWTLKPGDLSGLTLTTPKGLNGQLNLYVTSVANENDGSVAVSTPQAFNVRIGDYQNGYLIDIGIGVQVGGIGVGVQIGVGQELNLFPSGGGILGAAGMSVKEGESYLISDAPGLLDLVVGLLAKITFSGVPDTVTFSKGNKVGNIWEFDSSDLNNLYMNISADGAPDFNLVVGAKLIIGGPLNLVNRPVYIYGIADAPSLSASAGAATEDNNIPVTINASLNDGDNSETLTFLISGMPAGFRLNQGTNNGNGTWSVSTSQLAGLAIIPAANFSGAASFTVSAIATEDKGDQAVVQQTVNLNITAVADSHTITAQNFTGTENASLLLGLGVSLADNDGSESLISVTISGLPAGGSLTNATDNGNGTWSVSPANLGNVSFVPPANWSGGVTLNISSVSREGSNGAQYTTNSSIALNITADANAPQLSAQDTEGEAGQPINLDISASLVDTDGSESLSIVISGIPEGAVLSSGLNNGDGTWTLSPSQLTNLSITPPSGFSGDIALSVTAYSVENSNMDTASTTHNFIVSVNASMFMMMGMDSGNNGEGWMEMNGSNDNSVDDNSNIGDDSSFYQNDGDNYDNSFNN